MAVQLDPSQQAVLALPDGASAVVVGAPGSGKTETLVALAADRVARGAVAADELLVLAGSRRTAAALRDRLGRELAVVTTGPLARTAASVAFELVRARAHAEGRTAPRLLTGAEQDAIIRELLAGHLEDDRGPAWPERLGPAVRRLPAFRTELRELLMRAAEHGVGAAGLRSLGRAVGRPEWVAAADFADEYQPVVAAVHGAALDAAELGDEAVGALEAGLAGARLGAVRLVLVDELQEATEATMRMLAAFAARGAAVVGFGDPDIAANGFRGGAADAVGTLRARIGRPEAPELVLGTVHRQGPALRTVVAGVSGRIGTAGQGRQRAAAPGGRDAPEPVVAVVAEGRTGLVDRIARELRERHLRDRVPWSELLVVARSAGEVPELARALAHARVPTRTLGGGRALGQERAAHELLRLVDVALRPERLDGEAARGLLLGPYGGFDAVSLRRLRSMLRREELAGGGARHGDELLAEALGAEGRLATVEHPLARDYSLARRAARVAERLARIRALGLEGAPAEELLWEAWSGAGVAEEWRERALGTGVVAEETGRALDAVVALFAAARRFAEREPDRPVEEFLDELLDADVPEDSLAPRPASDAVLVATPAGAAGVEADLVVVTGLQEGRWPDLRLRGSLLGAPQLAATLAGATPDVDERREVLSDELRLLALAVSRARSRVVLAAVQTEDETPSPLIDVIGRSLLAAGLVPEQDDPALLVPRRGAPETPSFELRGLVGELRRRLAASIARAEAAGAAVPDAESAAALAALAAAGVEGAAPAEWRGLAGPSSESGLWELSDPETVVRVSPSSIEKLERSSLEWFVDWAAATPSGVAAGLGTIVHAALERFGLDGVEAPSADELWSLVEPRLAELGLDAGWELERQRVVARAHVESLAEYLADMVAAGGRLAAPELTVTRDYPLDAAIARLSGKVDRVERGPEGVVIVDLKTGRDVGRAGAAAHPQLQAYQLAYADGAFDELLAADGAEHGLAAARLLFTGTGMGGRPYTARDQRVMGEEELAAFRQRVVDRAREMTGPVYRAVELERDGSPDVRRIHLPGEVSDDG